MWRFRETAEGGQFGHARDQMVDAQLAGRGITDPRVLGALRHVPRHLFVPPDSHAYAYEDHPVQIGYGQTISQPYMVALMTQALELEPTDRVLEIGTGSAYQTAILAELAGEVVTVERNADLAEAARVRLRAMGYGTVTVITGDGTLGYPPSAPYNAILVTAGGPKIPEALRLQLGSGGRLLCPVGSRDTQRLIKVVRTDQGLQEYHGATCVFVPLIGHEGWPEE